MNSVESSRGNESAREVTSPDESQKVVVAHRLSPFVGTWRIVGRQYETPFGKGATIRGHETFEWLPGQRFLVHRLEATLGGEPMATIEIVGAERGPNGYTVQSFYSDGRATAWDLSPTEGTWILWGRWTENEKVARVRCTVAFAHAGDSKTAKWERSLDGKIWQTFWVITAARESL